MKKLLFLSILISALFSAQDFVITPENFKNNSDKSKNFIVKEFVGQTQKDLFVKAKSFIYSKFKNLKGDGYNEVEYSFIKLRASTVMPAKKFFGAALTTLLTVTYELSFKDGKVMIKPNFDEIEVNDKYNSRTYLTGGSGLLGKSIFKKDGEVWLPTHYEVINEEVNDFTKQLEEALKNSAESSSDW